MADMYAGGSASFDEKTGMNKPAFNKPSRPGNLTQAERAAARAAKRKAELLRDAARRAAKEPAKKPVPMLKRPEQKMTRAARQAALAAKRKTRSGAMITGTGSATGMTY